MSLPIGIVTNGPTKGQQELSEEIGVYKYVDRIITSESVGVAKPHSLIFEKALEYFGTKAQKAIMVGDSYEKDVIGAIRSGITPIWYTPHSAPKNRTYEGKIIEVINQFDKKSFLTLLEK